MHVTCSTSYLAGRRVQQQKVTASLFASESEKCDVLQVCAH